MSLSKKIDFAVIMEVEKANPNGDPLNGNRPRISYDEYGEISDVCLKRKIRNRLMQIGKPIFVQSDDSKIDGYTSLKARAEGEIGKPSEKSSTAKEDYAKKACEKWLDVRAFGQLFAFSGKKGKKGEDGAEDGVSIPIRGPVSIHSAFSVSPISITSTQITKSVNSEDKDGKKGRDTMGMKHRVDYGVYVFYGSMNPQLAEKTGFSDGDKEAIKEILPTLFENDTSSARQDGSMRVIKLIWWEHDSKAYKLGQYSSAKVHGSLNVEKDGSYQITPLDGLKPEEIDGF